MKTKIMSLLLCLALVGACGCSDDDETVTLPASLNGAWNIEAKGVTGVGYFVAEEESFTYAGQQYTATYNGTAFDGRFRDGTLSGQIYGQVTDRNRMYFTQTLSQPGFTFTVYVTGTR